MDINYNQFEEIKIHCLEQYNRYYDKFMLRIPNTSEYKALFHLSDDEIKDFIVFFDAIKWKTAYDEVYSDILKDYQIKRRKRKILNIQNVIEKQNIQRK